MPITDVIGICFLKFTTMQRNNSGRAIPLVIVCAISSTHTNAAEVTGILGLEYSQGEYGTSTTTRQWSAPFGLKYDSNFGYTKISSAFVSVSNVNPNAQGEALPCGNAVSTNKNVQGFGDTTVSFIKHVQDTGTFQLDAGAKIKFATGDVDKCLSTGKNDYSLQMDAFKQTGGVGFFGTAGWTYKGKPDVGGQTINYKNPIYFSVGLSKQISSQNSAGISFDYRDKLLDGRSSVQELTLFGVHRINQQLRFQPYVMKGFTASSPAMGIGINVLNSF